MNWNIGEDEMKKALYISSKYWNRVIYFIINISIKLIWDQTGRNTDLLKKSEVCRQYTQDIMTTF